VARQLVAPVPVKPASHGGGRSGKVHAPASQLATRLAFSLIILFVLAQVGWWLIFQERYMSEVTRERLSAWQRDALTATTALQASGDDAGLLAELTLRYPHLRLDSGRFVVDEGARAEFIRSQRGNMRMFAYEVPFFVLVILLSLVFIAWTLRSERELKRRQQNFLSAVTHEFKTPISTLRLLIETSLLRPLPAEKLREYLGRMAGEVARLEQTSEQVLASARLEQSPEARLLGPVELGELVGRIVERQRQGLEARGARITVERTAESLPVSVDEDAFAMVLGNLLDNAVKYTPGEPKPVTVRLEAGADLAMVHIEDEGIGIREGEEERIFDRFYRSGDEMTREATGMGLGLHLVRRTVEAMNGWVRCANREGGKGARFTVVLPQRLAATRFSRQAVPQARKA
jgi:two-component system sensor histidine kinase SenX3